MHRNSGMGRRQMRRITGVLAAAILVALLPIAPAQAAVTGDCSPAYVRGMMRYDQLESIVLRTFNVALKADKSTYKVGQTAIVRATVTRPAHEDPLGVGVPLDPPTTMPAAEVSVGIGLRIRDVFLFGYSVTDENGKAVIKVAIKRYAPAGKALVDGFAWKRQAETPCANVEENGYISAPGLFKVVKA